MRRPLRMPIVYVVLVVAVALGLVLRQRPRRQTAAPPTATPAPEVAAVAAPAVPPVEPVEHAADPAPIDSILRTPEGLRRKVLIRALGLRAYEGATGGEPNGSPLDYFSIHFIRAVSPPGGEGRFLIGPESGPPLGWVPERAVVEWDSRLMAVPTAREARKTPLRIYRERGCLIAALEGKPCPGHAGGTCPMEAEEPPQSAPGGNSLLGMPVLSSRTATAADGTSRNIHEVACLVRDLAPLPPPTEPPPELVQPLRQVYIAFVVDTTQSMQGPIAAVKSFASRLAAEMAAKQSQLFFHLALVEYRDDSRAFGFVSRRLTDFTTPARFAEKLSALTSAPEGDGTTAESVYAGLSAALPGSSTRTPLSWPGGVEGQAATQLVVLLGDAPDHDGDVATAQRLAARARGARIGIAAVELEPPPERQVLTRSERGLYHEQWSALADGSYRPSRPGQGLAAPLLARLALGPGEAEAATVATLAQGIRALLDDRLQAALGEAARRQEEVERSLREVRTAADKPIDALTPVLVDTHSSEAVPQARPDPRANGLRAPSLRRGWLAEEQGGERLVSLKVLMTRAELDALIREYLGVEAAAQSSGNIADALVGITTAAAAGETTFLARDRGRLTFDEHIRRLQGLPAGRPDSLLHRTRADLLQADQVTRAALADRLSTAVGQLVRQRASIAWDDPLATVSGMALIPYEWIDL